MLYIDRAIILLLACLLPSLMVAAQSSPRQSANALAKQKNALIETQLRKAVESDPEDFAANHNLGEFYIQQKRFAAAIPYLEKAQRLEPAHYVNSYDLALTYVLTGEAAKARALIRQTLAIKKTSELYQLLGEVEENSGDIAAAATAYHQAAQIEPTEKNILSLGNLLIKSSNYAEARKFFEYGLQKYPRSAQLKVGLGIVKYSQGQYDDAVKTLCEAADLEPSDARPYLFLGEMSGVSIELGGEITKRMAQFVKYHPQNARAYYYYAINLRQGFRNAQTSSDPQVSGQIETLLKKAIELDPKFPSAHFELGAFYADRQDYAAAMIELRRAIQLKPDFEKAHYRLAQIYQRTGQSELAAEEMEIFRRLKEEGSRNTRNERNTPNP